jgi:hypothetical protein
MVQLSLAVLAAMSSAAMARAELIEFTFGGELEQVVGEVPHPWSGVGPGTPFSVTYVFDSDAPDQDNSPAFGVYDAILSYAVTMDGVSLTTETGSIRVELTGIPNYAARFSILPIGTGASGSVLLSGFGALEDDSLPLDINLDQWTFGRTFEIVGLNNGEHYEAAGVIETFSRRIVPSPGTLTTTVLYILLGSKRRRKS